MNLHSFISLIFFLYKTIFGLVWLLIHEIYFTSYQNSKRRNSLSALKLSLTVLDNVQINPRRFILHIHLNFLTLSCIRCVLRKTIVYQNIRFRWRYLLWWTESINKQLLNDSLIHYFWNHRKYFSKNILWFPFN